MDSGHWNGRIFHLGLRSFTHAWSIMQGSGVEVGEWVNVMDMEGDKTKRGSVITQ